MRSHTLQSVVLPFLVVASAAATATAQGWILRNTLTAPAARNSHAMCYDTTRGVAVMFGGYDGTNVARGDLWEWNGFGWVARIVPNGPTARWGHGMAFDTRRSRAVIFGGYQPNVGFLSDTWEWDGSAWQQRVTAQSPSPRGYYGMAYDSIRGRAIVFGGSNGTLSYLADTWEFDGLNWAHSAASGPGGRRGTAMTFDDTRGQVVLFGGGDGTQTFNETWTYDGLAWTQRATPTAPSPRWQAQIEHDTLCGRAVLHGGSDAALANNYGDSWAWDGASWTQLAGTSPQARHGAASAFDAQRGQTVMFGGRDSAGFKADTWQLGSPCSRTMSVVTAPQVGSTAAFRFDYPGAAAGHWFFHLLTLHEPNTYPVPIPGFASLGLARVDLFNIRRDTSGLLDTSGTNMFQVVIPADNVLVGLPFDVQSVDINLFTNTIYWAGNDVEVSIAPVIPPVAGFTATPTFGNVPLVVSFTDTTTQVGPTSSWQWDFNNDGSIDSLQRNPTHTYTTPGLYSVRLIASNIAGTSTLLRRNLVYVGPIAPGSLANMVNVSAGTFQMGANDLASVAAAPMHGVNLSLPFWVGRYEVTQAEYHFVLGSNPSYFQGANYSNAPQRPVEQVTWHDAMSYCAALTASEAAAGRLFPGYQYRLPTEAEWEYVCRAGTVTGWSTGSSLAVSQANFANNVGQTTVVGSYAPNSWGLFDMHGNVFEWCLDSWDGSPNYPSSAVSDPFVSTGVYRVYRGGSWCDDASLNRSARRFAFYPNSPSLSLGFRVVCAPAIVP